MCMSITLNLKPSSSLYSPSFSWRVNYTPGSMGLEYFEGSAGEGIYIYMYLYLYICINLYIYTYLYTYKHI